MKKLTIVEECRIKNLKKALVGMSKCILRTLIEEYIEEMENDK